MYYTLAATLLCVVFLVAWFWHGLYIMIFLGLIYFGLVFMRRDDYTGYATYDWWRRLRVWRRISATNVMLGDETLFTQQASSANYALNTRQYLFIVLPNASNASLIWTFGLHGNGWPGVEHVRPCYIIPRCYFWIPGMREFMLASGAVSDRGKTSGNGLEDVVMDLLSRGRSVAYCPTGMMDALSVQRTDVIETRQPGLALFRMALETNTRIVPVLCDGENDRRYIFWSNRWIRRVQGWCIQRTGRPWPLIYFPDWSTNTHAYHGHESTYGHDDERDYNDMDLEAQQWTHIRHTIDVQMGPVIDPRAYSYGQHERDEKTTHDPTEAMQRDFLATIENMSREIKEVVFKVS